MKRSRGCARISIVVAVSLIAAACGGEPVANQPLRGLDGELSASPIDDWDGARAEPIGDLPKSLGFVDDGSEASELSDDWINPEFIFDVPTDGIQVADRSNLFRIEGELGGPIPASCPDPGLFESVFGNDFLAAEWSGLAADEIAVVIQGQSFDQVPASDLDAALAMSPECSGDDEASVIERNIPGIGVEEVLVLEFPETVGHIVVVARDNAAAMITVQTASAGLEQPGAGAFFDSFVASIASTLTEAPTEREIAVAAVPVR